jgi:hypothetical protein
VSVGGRPVSVDYRNALCDVLIQKQILAKNHSIKKIALKNIFLNFFPSFKKGSKISR